MRTPSRDPNRYDVHGRGSHDNVEGRGSLPPIVEDGRGNHLAGTKILSLQMMLSCVLIALDVRRAWK